MDITYYYYYILQYSPLLPILFGIVRYDRFNGPLKVFFWYLTVSLTLTVAMTILALQRMNNLWLMNISVPIYTVLLFYVLSRWQANEKISKCILFAIPFMITVWFIELFFYSSFTQFTVVTRPVQGLLIVAAACTTIFSRSDSFHGIYILHDPPFLISAGLLTYYGGMLMVNIFSHYLSAIAPESLRSALLIQPLLNLISHIFYFGGFYWHCKKSISFGLL